MGFEYHKETPEEKIYNKKKSMGLNETLYFLNDILPDKADYVMKALNISLPYENAEKQPMYVLYAWAFCTEINREEFRNKSLPFVTICEKGNSPFEYPDSYAISVKEGNYKKFLTMLDTGKFVTLFLPRMI